MKRSSALTRKLTDNRELLTEVKQYGKRKPKPVKTVVIINRTQGTRITHKGA